MIDHALIVAIDGRGRSRPGSYRASNVFQTCLVGPNSGAKADRINSQEQFEQSREVAVYNVSDKAGDVLRLGLECDASV